MNTTLRASILLFFFAIAGLLKAEELPNGPLLAMGEVQHNFGDIERRGGDVQAKFAYTNIGNEPLVVISASVSCTCTKVKFSRKPLAPGKTDTLRVTYQPRKQPLGRMHRIIKIASNSAGGAQSFVISGNVVDNK